MFNIGMSEMILVFIVALIVFGPDRLPEIARTLGKSVNELKKMGNDIVDAATETKEWLQYPMLMARCFTNCAAA